MNDDKKAVCDVCGTRRATHYICYGGTGQSSHLCEECFQTSAPPDVLQSDAAVRAAHCQYCGHSAGTGGTDILAFISGVQQTKFMCLSCSQEFHRFIQQEVQLALEYGANSLPQVEQRAAFAKLREKADAHMIQWVSARGSR